MAGLILKVHRLAGHSKWC